jgi:hypothetical protein
MQKLLICSTLSLEILCLISVTIIWEITQIVFFTKLHLAFGKKYKKV